MAAVDTATRLAQLLRSLRYDQCLTQLELAARSGVDERRISAYELRRRPVSLQQADRILAGMGLQLRLETEPLWAELDAKIDELAALPIAQRLRTTQVSVVSMARWLAAAEPIIDGPAAALIQGVPIAVGWLDLCVLRDNLDHLVEPMTKRPSVRWYERDGCWVDSDNDPRIPGALRWLNYQGEFRITLVDHEPASITIMVEDPAYGATSVRVRPLVDVELNDPDTGRLLTRVRERRAAIIS
jgi:transcriptional regulator with XRE-family HTH domain